MIATCCGHASVAAGGVVAALVPGGAASFAVRGGDASGSGVGVCTSRSCLCC